MQWLNYHHLHYFWVVAREGSITSACRTLRVAQPTVSAQIKALEESLGLILFHRVGRRLTLTEAGHVVFRYADEMFSLGREMIDTLTGQGGGAARPRFNVGVSESLPRLLVHRLLEPVTSLAEPVNLVCHEGKHPELLARLSVYELDILLTDAPIGPRARVRAFNHLLGECGVSVFVARARAEGYRGDFPRSLHRAPFIMPISHATLRLSLENWFAINHIEPTIVAEFEDSSLTKSFGQTGLGLFVMPTVEEQEVLRQYDVALVGRISEVRESFYAISSERRVKNPAVRAITETAHKSIFEPPAGEG